jgi:hypothetical protein
MPKYLRAFIPGGTFFFTVTLQECGIYGLEGAANDNLRSLKME